MSWFKDKYGTTETQATPDPNVQSAVEEYHAAHEDPSLTEALLNTFKSVASESIPSLVAKAGTGLLAPDVLMKLSNAAAEESKKPLRKLTQGVVDKFSDETVSPDTASALLNSPLPAMGAGLAVGSQISPQAAVNAAREVAIDPRTYLYGGMSAEGKTAKTAEEALALQTEPPAILRQGQALPKYAENINLKTMPADVRQKLYEVVSSNPSIGITPKISNAELVQKASELKDTPIINYLTNLKDGSLEAEALKLRMGNTQLLRDALKSDLTDMKGSLDAIIESDVAKQRKVASIFGRGLQQQTISPEAQQELAFAIEDKIKAIKRDPAFGNDKELIGTLENLRKTVINPAFEPTAFNKVYYVWLNSILSSPMTHIVNTTSNTLFALSKIPEKFASSVMDLPISLFTGKRTQFFGEIPAMIKGAFSREALPAELTQAGSKLDVYAQPIKGLAGKIIGTPTNLLQLEDNLAKNVVGKMELYAQRYAGKTGDELIQAVKGEQLYRTFQNEPTALAKGLMTLRSKVPFVRYVVPFLRTPSNIIERGLERTPLILGKMAYKGVKGTYTQAELAKDMGLLSMSSMLTGYIAWQVGKGNLNGDAPEGKAERDAFFRQGKKPNSIKVGDSWIPLDRLEPFGTSFSTIANLITKYQSSDKDIPAEKAMDAVASLGKTLTTKSYLSGMTGLLKGLSDPELYGAGFFRRTASGAVPNALSFFANLKDPYYREANSVLDYMKMKVPFLSETLPPKLNALGEPVKRDVLNIGKANEDPLNQLAIGFPSKKIGDVKLSPEQYNQVLQERGAIIKPLLEKITSNPDWWNSLSPEARDKIIENVTSKGGMIAKKKTRMQMEMEGRRGFNEWKQFKNFGKSKFALKYGKK